MLDHGHYQFSNITASLSDVFFKEFGFCGICNGIFGGGDHGGSVEVPIVVVDAAGVMIELYRSPATLLTWY